MVDQDKVISTPDEPIERIPTDALVVLVGPSGAGKTTWARHWFRDDQIVSSDKLRALVGTGENDQNAGTDAFDILDNVVERRLKRGLLTVIDSLGFDDKRRANWLASAGERKRPTVAVVFTTSVRDCRARNKTRSTPVPSKVLTAQLKRRDVVKTLVEAEFDSTIEAIRPVIIPSVLTKERPQTSQPASRIPSPSTLSTKSIETAQAAPGLKFGLHIPSFTWPGESSDIGPRLAAIAAEAEQVGFNSIWVMDHMLQIPQVGREWEPMLDSYTTLAYLSAATERLRLGALVTGITYRNIAHLGKILATLDVLSSGRAECGLGLAWFKREHDIYGWSFPPVAERYELLEDALELLPMLWGPGSPTFEGRRVGRVTATCYPRPIQHKIPILVGGSGQRRTLRLVAAHADACNLFGEPDRVQDLVRVLHQHCDDLGRDPTEIKVTHLSQVLVAPHPDRLSSRVDEMRGRATAEDFIDRSSAGLVAHHVERFERLAAAGVDEAIVSLADIGYADSLETFGAVIDAFA